MEPAFRRAVNVFEFFVYNAVRKTRELMTAGGDGAVLEDILKDDNVASRWKRAYDYAGELASSFKEVAALKKRERGSVSVES